MKKRISVMLIIVLAVIMFAGCKATTKETTNTGGTPKKEETQSNKTDKPVEIDWLAYTSTAQPEKDSEIIRLVEEKFNAKFNFWFIDSKNWDEALNIRLATGDMPDVLRLRNAGNLPNYIKQGIATELPIEKIKQAAPNYYAAVEKYNTDGAAWDQTSFEGKNYGFIGMNVDGSYAKVMIWRKDWLDAVGITKVPETLEEYEAAMYAFANNDPDGDGVKNTYGLSDRNMEAVFGAFGVPYDIDEKLAYVLVEGKPDYAITQPGTKEALKVLQKWYKDGVIDPEFVTGENTGGYWALSHAFSNGAIGSTSGVYYHWYPPLQGKPNGGPSYADALNVSKNAEITYGLAPVGPSGDSGMMSWGVYTEPIIITTKGQKDERKADTILAMLEEMYSDIDYFRTIRFGLEGKHFDIDNGAIVTTTNDIPDTRTIGLHLFNFATAPPDFYKKLIPADYAFADANAVGPNYPPIHIPASDIVSKNSATLTTLAQEMVVQIITGEKPVEYFDEFVEIFNKNGGNESRQSLQETYSSIKGK